MQVTIQEVLETQQKTSKSSGKPYTLTTFKGSDGKLYKDVYGKLEQGQTVNGEWKTGEYGDKFEITRSAGAGRSFGRSPEETDSIIWQTSLKAATEAVRDFYSLPPTLTPSTHPGKGLLIEDYAKEIDKLAVHFHNLIVAKPKSVAPKDVVPTEVPDEINYDGIDEPGDLV